VVLTQTEARAFYDRFGAKQDAQAFYEDPAIDALIAHAGFGEARGVFECGCGTGRFAAELLSKHLASAASYVGTELSSTMLELARERLAPYGERVRLERATGKLQFPVADQSVDRVVANYVLDLLSDTDIRQVVAEAHRILRPGGKLCLVSLTHGVSVTSRFVIALWSAAFRIKPSLVGGCRPIELVDYLDQDAWSIDHRQVVTPYGVSSEVLVAGRRRVP
jgi:ubiquinone/menaquinone biosynthesis C-methylase UbiE